MKTILYFPILALGLILVACTQVDPPVQGDCEGVRWNDPIPPFQRQDEFHIVDARVDSNELMVNVQYGGGCAADEVEFTGWMTELPTQGPRPVYQLNLTLKDNDNCEALITIEVCYDLSAAGKPSATKGFLNVIGPEDTFTIDWE